MDSSKVPLSVRALALEPPRASLLMRFPNALRLADDGLGVGLGVPRRRKIQNVDHESEIPLGPSGVPGQFSTSRAELQ